MPGYGGDAAAASRTKRGRANGGTAKWRRVLSPCEATSSLASRPHATIGPLPAEPHQGATIASVDRGGSRLRGFVGSTEARGGRHRGKATGPGLGV